MRHASTPMPGRKHTIQCCRSVQALQLPAKARERTPYTPQVPTIDHKRANAPHTYHRRANAPTMDKQRANAPHTHHRRANAPTMDKQRANAPHTYHRRANAPTMDNQRANAPTTNNRRAHAPIDTTCARNHQLRSTSASEPSTGRSCF